MTFQHLRLQVLEALLLVRDALLLTVVVLLALLELRELAVEVLLFLDDAVFERGDFLAPGLDGLVELRPRGENVLFRLDRGLAQLRVGGLLRLGQNPIGFCPDRRPFTVDLLPEKHVHGAPIRMAPATRVIAANTAKDMFMSAP